MFDNPPCYFLTFKLHIVFCLNQKSQLYIIQLLFKEWYVSACRRHRAKIALPDCEGTDSVQQ